MNQEFTLKENDYSEITYSEDFGTLSQELSGQRKEKPPFSSVT